MSPNKENVVASYSQHGVCVCACVVPPMVLCVRLSWSWSYFTFVQHRTHQHWNCALSRRRPCTHMNMSQQQHQQNATRIIDTSLPVADSIEIAQKKNLSANTVPNRSIQTIFEVIVRQYRHRCTKVSECNRLVAVRTRASMPLSI